MFKTKYRIYYEDTDAGGIMYYANYLKLAERSRTDWLRTLGFDQSQLDVLFVVRKVEIEYLSPAKLDDEVLVETSLQNIGRASISFRQEFFVGGKKLSFADVLIVCIDKDFKPTKVPEEITNKMSN